MGLERGDGRYLRLLKLVAQVNLLILEDWGLTPLSIDGYCITLKKRIHARTSRKLPQVDIIRPPCYVHLDRVASLRHVERLTSEAVDGFIGIHTRDEKRSAICHLFSLVRKIVLPLLHRSWYSNSIDEFRAHSDEAVLGTLLSNSSSEVLTAQRDAWAEQCSILRHALKGISGRLYLEFTIPRMGHRADTVLLVNGLLFVIEFKVNARAYSRSDIDQVYDYALDLKHFHEGSHDLQIVPILVATHAHLLDQFPCRHQYVPGMYLPLCVNAEGFPALIRRLLSDLSGPPTVAEAWESSQYRPTPTIVEAAKALYSQHSVADISRNDAGAQNLSQTSKQISEIIDRARRATKKPSVLSQVFLAPGKHLSDLILPRNSQTRRTSFTAFSCPGTVHSFPFSRRRWHVIRSSAKKQRGVASRKEPPVPR